MPHDVLGKISNRIINEVKGINRVCYDVSSKPPATIECGPQGRFSQFCSVLISFADGSWLRWE